MRWMLTLFLLLPLSLYAKTEGDIHTLASWMQGGFTSENQSRQDDSFFNIHLYMKRIWDDNQQGYWLYVEQAAASRLQEPYRQRVYHVTKTDDGRFKSEVFTFDNAMSYAGDWKKDVALADLDPSKLIVREGCAVYLAWSAQDNAFIGSTDSKKCKSNLRGATYATSKVTVFSDRIESWDQGYDADDNQVWGAVKAGYVFDRLN